MTERDRLLFLISDMPEAQTAPEMADYFLSKGVLTPLVNIGDFIYVLWDVFSEEKYAIYCAEVLEIIYAKSEASNPHIAKIKVEPLPFRGRTKEYNMNDYNTLFFSTIEEARAALETIRNNEGESE